MTEEIIIDVSNCSHKRDDDCMEVPICNEYGDLMGYQSCEAQTLCPYRSQKKIERLEQLKNKYYQQTLNDEITISDLITKCNDLEQENKELERKAFLAEQNVRTTAATFCEKDNKIIELEQENKELKEKIIELSEEKGHLIVENNTLKESDQSLSILGTDLASAHETVRKEFFRADKNKDMWREKAENYRSALEKILESAKFAQCLPCGSGNLEDCLNCDDDTTNNGQFCMEKRIHEIKTKCVEVLSE